VGSPVVKNAVEDLEEYLENVYYLKSSTTSSVKLCRWFQIIDMLNNRQISPNRNCSTLAIPWCFYKISRAFDGISTSIIWQKYHPPELKHRPIFPLVLYNPTKVPIPRSLVPIFKKEIIVHRKISVSNGSYPLHTIKCFPILICFFLISMEIPFRKPI